jgi:hypothetical protein
MTASAKPKASSIRKRHPLLASVERYSRSPQVLNTHLSTAQNQRLHRFLSFRSSFLALDENFQDQYPEIHQIERTRASFGVN